jgi:hypothetical protein
MGIGINADATGIGIPASIISVRYRRIPVPEDSGTGRGRIIPVPEWSGIVIFFSFQYRTD